MALYLETPARFGAAVKYLREKRGWSQQALADRVETTQRHVCLVERGKAGCSMKLAFRIVSAFDLMFCIAPPISGSKGHA